MGAHETSTPLVVLLYRMRHAKYDKEWLRVHEHLSSRLRRMSEADIRVEVIQYYKNTYTYEMRVAERDISALMSDVFYV